MGRTRSRLLAPQEEIETSHLGKENQQLTQRVCVLEKKVSDLQDVVHNLQRDMQELRNSQGASGTQHRATEKSAPLLRSSIPRTSDKVFHVQIQIAGKTGGCEKTFLKDVTQLLSRQGVSLQVKEFAENSKHLLLLFCPIASRMDTDIENALQELTGEQKVLLVVMHYVPKDNPGTSVDASWRGTHPALVLTVHTRYSLQDGFYPCEKNTVAVADVAAAIKDLAEDQ